MFSYDGVKEQQDPFNSLLNPDCTFNHCITSFYDQDSEEDIIHAKCSTQDAICYLEHLVDIADTPLNDLMRIVHANPALQGVDLQLMKKKIIREKNKIKRQRAKNRKSALVERRVPAYIPIVDEQDEEYKKQRNRISAQISRDRKKEKTKALEELNKQLQEECRQQKEENQRLRKQAKERTNRPEEVLKSPFARMLIFLGIFVLFALIKDLLGASESAKSIVKLQESTSEILSVVNDTHSKTYFQPLEALEQIEQTLTENVENKGVMARLKEGIKQKVLSWMGSKVLQGIPQRKGILTPAVMSSDHV